MYGLAKIEGIQKVVDVFKITFHVVRYLSE